MADSTLQQFGGVDLERAPDHGEVIVVRLHQGGRPVVVLDEQLIDDLGRALDAIPADARGVIVASASPKVFIAGADLKGIRHWDDPTLLAYLEKGAGVFAKLLTLRCPTAAAINGAALGGGFELAGHCDGLIAAPGGKPYPVGLPEAGLGLCPGWGGTNILPARMYAPQAMELTATGRPLSFLEAAESGVFDAVAESPEQLLAEATHWVIAQPTPTRDGAPRRSIGRGDVHTGVREALDAFDSGEPGTPRAATGEAVAAGINDGWESALRVERTRLVELRHTKAAVEALDAFFAKSSAPKPSATAD